MQRQENAKLVSEIRIDTFWFEPYCPLRQENAKLVSEIRGMKEATNRILKINEELRLRVIELNMDNQGMKKRLAYYDNFTRIVDSIRV